MSDNIDAALSAAPATVQQDAPLLEGQENETQEVEGLEGENKEVEKTLAYREMRLCLLRPN